MAAKRKLLVPPPQPLSESSSDDMYSSSPDEEEEEVQVQIPSATKPRIPSESDDSEEEEDEEADDDEKEEAKEMNVSKGKQPESEPEKEKQKAKEPETVTSANGKSKSDYFKKLWSSEDELVLIDSLMEFYLKNKRAPLGKDCESILDTMKGKLSFDVTVKQVVNKLRVFRDLYNNWKKKGTDISTSNEKTRAILDISDKFWGDLNKTKKKVDNEKIDNENELNNGTGNGGTEVKSGSEFPYLIEAIGKLKKDNPKLCKFYGFAFEYLDRSIARDFEAKFKKQRVNKAKFTLMKMEMMSKLSKELYKLGG